MSKRSGLVFVIFLLSCFTLSAQGTAGYGAKYEYRSIIDVPSAGILNKGYVGVTANNLPNGVVISKIEVGVFENFSFGISYGGSNVIGTGVIDWYKMPGLNVRVRLFDETTGMPALTVGFDSQGKGAYFDALERYEIKSPGFYAGVSKTFEFLGYLVLHGTVNYSLERQDDDKDLNAAVGLEKTIGNQVSFIAEYDFANNDNTGDALGDGIGYLNMGIRWSVGDGFTLGLDLRDMLDNKKINSNKADRALFVEYIQPIF